MPASLRILNIISIISTAICGAAYVATFFGQAWYSVGFFVLFLFVLAPFIIYQWRSLPRRNLVSEVYGQIPLWLKIAAGALLVFLFINFMVNRELLHSAQPVRLDDGRLVLQSGKQIFKVLTPAEFIQAQATQVRIMAGHLVAFYGLAVLALRAIWIKNGPAMADAKVTGN